MKTRNLLLTGLLALMTLGLSGCYGDNNDEPVLIIDPVENIYHFSYNEDGTIDIAKAKIPSKAEFDEKVDNQAWRAVSFARIFENGNLDAFSDYALDVVYFYDKGVVTRFITDSEGKNNHDVFGILYDENSGKVDIAEASICFSDPLMTIIDLNEEVGVLYSVEKGGYSPNPASSTLIPCYFLTVYQRLTNKELSDLLKKHNLQLID